MNGTFKILHTSDWHLGKKLYSYSRHEEQSQFLRWLVETLEKEKINLLFITGDIFDSPTPPNFAISEYFSFLHRISTIKDLKTFIISGNHDSPKFLQAPSELLRTFNIEVVTHFNDSVDFKLKFYEENVHIKCLPYFRSTDLIKYANEHSLAIKDESDNFNFLPIIEHFLSKDIEPESINICLAHHLFANYNLAGSELGLHLSGLESIPKESFKNYQGVFLGHIHKKQDFSSEIPYMAYCGSPIPLRFSETHKKQISISEVSNESWSTKWIEVPQTKKMLSLEISQDELPGFAKELSSHKKEILLELFVSLEEPHPDLYEHINRLLPKHVKLLSLQIEGKQFGQLKDHKKINGLSMSELFCEFYRDKYQKDIPLEIKKQFENIQQEILENKKDLVEMNGFENEVQ